MTYMNKGKLLAGMPAGRISHCIYLRVLHQLINNSNSHAAKSSLDAIPDICTSPRSSAPASLEACARSRKASKPLTPIPRFSTPTACSIPYRCS